MISHYRRLDLSDSLKFCTDKKLKLQSSKACATKFIQFLESRLEFRVFQHFLVMFLILNYWIMVILRN